LSTILCGLAGSIAGMALKDRIREARDAYKGPVEELAKKVGVSRSAFYQWLAGDTKNLRLENLFALAEETGYSAKWIATGHGTKRDSSALAHNNGPDLSFLEITMRAVEEYLDKQDLTLDPEAKAKAVTILYEICAEQGKVEQPAVARILRLVA